MPSEIEIIEEFLSEQRLVADAFIKEKIEPIGKIANPETVLGKPYEMWTPEDAMRAQGIYKNIPDVLSRFIANKEIKELRFLESEV